MSEHMADPLDIFRTEDGEAMLEEVRAKLETIAPNSEDHAMFLAMGALMLGAARLVEFGMDKVQANIDYGAAMDNQTLNFHKHFNTIDAAIAMLKFGVDREEDT